MTKKPTTLSKVLVRTAIVLIILLIVFGLLKMINII